MTRDEIESGWLTISVSKKREMKAKGRSTSKGRTPLGEKGLGRLSTQRLATKLELFSNSDKKDESAYHVYFNWDDFTEDALLTKVDVAIDPIDKKKQRKGTSLVLLNLKDPAVWSGTNVERIKGKLSQLIYPKKRKRPFKILLNIDGTQIDFDFLSDSIKTLSISRYSYTFYNNRLVVFGQIKLPKLKGNDARNYVHLVEADSGKSFFDFVTDSKNKKAFVGSGLKYVGRNGVFLEFKRTFRLEDIPKKHTVKDEEGNEVFISPGNFRGKIDEYNLSKDTVDITPLEEIFDEFSKYTAYIKGQTGVRVFRDGFGIRPFGLDGEDWLKLHQEQTSGSSYYGLRPGNVIGFVEIGARSNPNLLEKTDREGIIDNIYYRNFYTINKKVVTVINALLEDIKRGYNDYRNKYGVSETGLNDQKDVFSLMQRAGRKAEELAQETKEIELEIGKVNQNVKDRIQIIKTAPLFAGDSREIDSLLNDVKMQLDRTQPLLKRLDELISDATKLRAAVHVIEPQINTLQEQLLEFSHLASLGMVAESLSHEMDNILDTLSQQSKTFSKHIKDNKYTDQAPFVYVRTVSDGVSSLRKQLSFLSPSLKYVRDEKELVRLGSFTSEVRDIYTHRLHQAEAELVIENLNDFEVLVNKGKLSQIFSNLILNSIFWLEEFRKTQKIKPRLTIKIEKPRVQFFDNGLGVDPSLEERIFQPFVSGKPKKSGRGLGLFITQQLLESYGCSILLLPISNEHGRRYIFQLNLDNITE